MKPVEWIKSVWKKFFRDSEVLFLAFIQAVVGAATYFWENPLLRDAVKAMFQPEYGPFVLVGMGALYALARVFRAKDL